MQQHDIFIITLSNPPLVGLYLEDNLIESFVLDGKISDSLLPFLKELLSKYTIGSIYYTSGPGSHMGTKLTYIALKTLEIAKEIKCLGVLGFVCNSDMPIKALGSLYFIKEKENIIIKNFKSEPDTTFALPQNLREIEVEKSAKPIHIVPAV